MRCVPVDTEICASNLALWGGVTYVMPRREATLLVKASGQQPGREVKLIAEPRPRTLALDAVTLLDQIAGALVVLGAAYLVWIRSGAMTWAFFTYSIQFNPGQSFQFYAWLQQWPRALLAQDVSSCVLQAAGYTGLLLFRAARPDRSLRGAVARDRARAPAAVARHPVPGRRAHKSRNRLRVPNRVRHAGLDPDRLCGQRRRARDFDRPSQGSVAARLPADSLGDLGLRGFIGLPAYLIAEISQETSLPASLFGEAAVTEDVSGLFYLVNGILCVFVVEAVRRPTVVGVWIPLRRATVLGLLLSAPAFLSMKN